MIHILYLYNYKNCMLCFSFLFFLLISFCRYYESNEDRLNSSDKTWATRIGESEIRVLESLLGGPGPFDTSRVVITHNYIHPRLSRSGKIGKDITSALLFNVSADPSEKHDLAAEYPE